MNKLLQAFGFVVGAAVGSATTWYFTKRKYETIAQEEIDSVKKTYSERYAKKDKDEQKYEPTPEDKELYSEILDKNGYTGYANVASRPKETKKKYETEIPASERPYVISPDEFGEFEDYRTINLSYYADEVLADEDDNIIEDIEGTVGEESLSHFGEYDDDAVHVRNDRIKCDYEILLDERFYYTDIQV